MKTTPRAAILVLLLCSCGGSPPPVAECGGVVGEPSGSNRVTDEAAEAWSRLDPERAAQLAARARRDGDDEDAPQIEARAHLALGRYDRAVAALRGVDDPVLLRLRARAQIAAGDFAGAVGSLDAARRHARDEEDPWTEAVLPALRRAAEGEPYRTSGATMAEIPLEELALPVVRVRVDAVEILAVVSSGTYLAVLDPSVRRAPGTIDELTLGSMRVRDVPHTVRSLRALRDELGADVGMVIGADLLLRLGATLDGPGGRLVLNASPPERSSTTSVPLLTPTGSFLVVPATIGPAEAWLTIDTAGLYPVALAPGATDSLGLESLDWRETSVAPSLATTVMDLGDLRADETLLVRGMLDESHAGAVGAPVAGSVGWRFLRQLTITFDAEARRIHFE